MSKIKPANVLVFSGLDPTGGAGVQADIETISSLGAKACSVITALTVQDTTNVKSYVNVESELIAQQAQCILNDIPIHCIKLGMIADEKIITVIHEIVTENPDIPLVIDPIFTAGGGKALTNSHAYQQLISDLIPLASIITPNSNEARQLTAKNNSLNESAEILLTSGCRSVLITGGHEISKNVCNTLYIEKQIIDEKWTRLPGEYHGSGCTLSASIATYIALGQDLKSAVYNAQHYTYNTLLYAKKIGQGQLIPNRFFATHK